jgi:hypothetical protein
MRTISNTHLHWGCIGQCIEAICIRNIYYYQIVTKKFPNADTYQCRYEPCKCENRIDSIAYSPMIICRLPSPTGGEWPCIGLSPLVSSHALGGKADGIHKSNSKAQGQTMKRPSLHEIPLGGIMLKPHVIVTMSIGQWDGLLAAAYDGGAVLLELDDNETPIRAYRRKAGADG